MVHDWWDSWLEKKHRYAVTPDEAWGPEEQFHALAAGEHSPVIHQTSTFPFHTVDEGAKRFVGSTFGAEKPFARVYTRLGNPTTEHLEKVLFHLECQHLIDAALAAKERRPSVGVLVTASGMGAISVVLMGLLQSGDAIVAGTVYGCTDSLLRNMAERFGIEVIWTDLSDLEAVERALDAHPRVAALYAESPTNPTLDLADIRALADLSEPRRIPLVVDNTFATPFLQQPFRLGADIVVHSLTKYVNGHSSGILGACLGPWEFINQDAFPWYKDLGVTPSPFESWQNSLHVKTLGYRVREASSTAARLAAWLEAQPEVAAVHYPGLASHPQHQLASRQMRMPGAMIAFELAGGYEPSVSLMNVMARRNTPMELAVSLGATTTYIQHPASMTHAGMPPEERAARGITDGLIRLSVGLEGYEFLRGGLEKGFRAPPR